MHNRRDLSFDLTLKESNSRVNRREKSFFRNLADNISRSIEKLTAPRKIDFEKKRINFSQHLTQRVIPRYSKLLEAQEKKIGFFEFEEENGIIAVKKELTQFSSFLKYLDNQGKEKIQNNQSLYEMCISKKKKTLDELKTLAKLEPFLGIERKTGARFRKILVSKREAIEKARFEKVKAVENRGRLLANIKNIECMLNAMTEKKIHVDEEKKNKLLFYREELIKLLRERIKAENALTVKKVLKINDRYLAFLRDNLDQLRSLK